MSTEITTTFQNKYNANLQFLSQHLSIGLAALFIVGASAASAQVYYDMAQMPGQSGYRSEIYETVTTADFLRAPANGVQRLAFTRGDSFASNVYACETKSPSNPATDATCTSLSTLIATDPSILLTTGRSWLIVDVITAETAGNVSYLTIRSHASQQVATGSGGGGGGGGGTDNPASYSPFDYGAIGDGTTDDAAAVQLAANAACTHGSPAILDMTRENGSAASYRFGSSINNSFFTSGVRFDGTVCTNAVTVTGNCNDRAEVKVLTGGNNGQALFATCDQDDAISGICETDGTVLTSQAYTFQCMTLEDDDPMMHGGQNSATYALPASFTDTPVYGQAVLWPGCNDCGVVAEWDSARRFLVVGLVDPRSTVDGGDDGDLPTTPVALTIGSFAAVTPDSVEREESVEGTHGLYLSPCDNCRVERMEFVGLSDEAIDMHKNSDAVTIIQNNCTGISSVAEGGSCVNFDSSTDGFVSENTCIAGKGSAGVATGSCYTIATNSTVPTDNLRLVNNTCVETGTGVDAIESCIAIAPNDSDITNVVISGMTIETNVAGETDMITIDGGVSRTAGVNIYDLVAEGGGRIIDLDSTQNNHQANIWNPTINYTGGGATTALVGFNIYGGSITGNGTVSTVSLGGAFAHTVQGATFNCENSCIYISGSSNTITGNTFTSVGNGSGIDYSVRELSGNNNVVNENQTIAFSSGATEPYRFGTTTGGTCLGTGSGANSYCDGVRNTAP